jgi:hypothetical protein
MAPEGAKEEKTKWRLLGGRLTEVAASQDGRTRLSYPVRLGLLEFPATGSSSKTGFHLPHGGLYGLDSFQATSVHVFPASDLSCFRVKRTSRASFWLATRSLGPDCGAQIFSCEEGGLLQPCRPPQRLFTPPDALVSLRASRADESRRRGKNRRIPDDVVSAGKRVGQIFNWKKIILARRKRDG